MGPGLLSFYGSWPTFIEAKQGTCSLLIVRLGWSCNRPLLIAARCRICRHTRCEQRSVVRMCGVQRYAGSMCTTDAIPLMRWRTSDHERIICKDRGYRRLSCSIGPIETEKGVDVPRAGLKPADTVEHLQLPARSDSNPCALLPWHPSHDGGKSRTQDATRFRLPNPSQRNGRVVRYSALELRRTADRFRYSAPNR